MSHKFHHQSHMRCGIDLDSGSGATLPPTVKQLLNKEHMVTNASLKVAQFHNDKKEVKRLIAHLAELTEQLRILRAFDPQIVRLMERVNVRNFREQTRQMKVTA